MNRPAPLLPFVLLAGCAVLLALLTAVSARRGSPRAVAGSLLVRHSPVFRWFTLVAGVLAPVGMTVVIAVYRPTRQDVSSLLGLYLFFTGLIVLLMWEAGRFYVLASPDGLEGRSAWRGTTVIRWDDLEAVRFHPLTGFFEFAGRDRARIRAHAVAARLADLITAVEAHIPPDALRPARSGYARIGRTLPPLPDEPVLEARRPRRVGEW